MDNRLRRVAAETPYWLQAAAVPGLTVALLDAGRIQDVLCFGTTKPGGSVPVTEETIVKAASLSKQALLYAALKTIEAGKLDIRRPLAQYLDRPFEADDADLGRITAYHGLAQLAPGERTDQTGMASEHAVDLLRTGVYLPANGPGVDLERAGCRLPPAAGVRSARDAPEQLPVARGI